MAAPTIVVSQTNGTSGSPTITDFITLVAFSSIDHAGTASSISTNNPIQVGNNSFEIYDRFKVTAVAPNNITNFGVSFSATAVTDGAGVSTYVNTYYACNTTYATPVATASTVATTVTTTDTGTPGTTLTAPANTVNSYSAYFTMQFQSTSGATGGNCTFASTWVSGNYTWS